MSNSPKKKKQRKNTDCEYNDSAYNSFNGDEVNVGASTSSASENIPTQSSTQQPDHETQSVSKRRGGNLTNFAHGVAFQLKLIQIAALRLKNKEDLDNFLQNYAIGSEIDWGEKFDDLIISGEQNGQNVIYFVQAKHLRDPKSDDGDGIKAISLLTDDEGDKKPLYLGKYLYSHLSITKKSTKFKEKKDGNNVIKEYFYVLCTNQNFVFEPTNITQILQKVQRKVKGKDYKNIIIEVEQINRETNNFKCPAVDDSKLPYQIINNTDEALIKVLMDECEEYRKKKKREEIKLTADDVTKFLEHLYFAVDQPHEKALDNPIGELISKQFNICSGELIKSHFSEEIFKWLKEKEKKDIDDEFMTNFCTKTTLELNLIECIGVTNMYKGKYKDIFENGIVKFKTDDDEIIGIVAKLKNFFNDKECQYVVLNTQNDLTILGCLAVYQFYNENGLKDWQDGNYFIMNFSSFIDNSKTFLNCIKNEDPKKGRIFHLGNKVKLLIVVCKGEIRKFDKTICEHVASEIKTMLDEFKNKNRNFKIIFVTDSTQKEEPSKNMKSLEFQEDKNIKFIFRGKIFLMLQEESREFLYERQINFQSVKNQSINYCRLEEFSIPIDEFIKFPHENSTVSAVLKDKVSAGNKSFFKCCNEDTFYVDLERELELDQRTKVKINEQIEVFKQEIEKVEQSKVPTLIYGHTGIGKSTEMFQLYKKLKVDLKHFWILLVNMSEKGVYEPFQSIFLPKNKKKIKLKGTKILRQES